MAFRIRKTGWDGDNISKFEKEWEANNKLYRDHLDKVAEDKDPDLWKYFYWDAFHDGEITGMFFWDTPGDITLHIECPNIKKRNGDSFDFIAPIAFECHFRSVVYFHYEHSDPEDLLYKQHNPSQYLFSEIDSLTEIIEKNKTLDEDGDVDDTFHSLIIEVLGCNTSFYIEMVFSQVDVYPKEPIAFELMLASDDFYVPIYRENEDMGKLPKWISNTSGFKNVFDSLDDDNDEQGSAESGNID